MSCLQRPPGQQAGGQLARAASAPTWQRRLAPCRRLTQSCTAKNSRAHVVWLVVSPGCGGQHSAFCLMPSGCTVQVSFCDTTGVHQAELAGAAAHLMLVSACCARLDARALLDATWACKRAAQDGSSGGGRRQQLPWDRQKGKAFAALPQLAAACGVRSSTSADTTAAGCLPAACG